MNREDFHSLSLRCVHFEEHANSLAQFLKVDSTKITKLTLEDCDIGDTCVTKLIQDCKNLKCLNELHLRKMGLGRQQHLKEILETLYDHKTVKILDLSYNNISGLKEISSLIVKNQHIREIYLNEEEDGVQVVNTKEDFNMLVAAIQKNLSIKKLEYGISKHLLTGAAAVKKEDIDLIDKEKVINGHIKSIIQEIQIDRKNKGTDTIDLSNIELELMIESVVKAFCVPGPSKIQKKKLILKECQIND